MDNFFKTFFAVLFGAAIVIGTTLYLQDMNRDHNLTKNQLDQIEKKVEQVQYTCDQLQKCVWGLDKKAEEHTKLLNSINYNTRKEQ